MKSKIIKQINKKANELLLDWVKNLVSDEEKEKINSYNLNQFLPVEGHLKLESGQMLLNFYTFRWAKQRIKRLYKSGVDLSQITMGDLELLVRQK